MPIDDADKAQRLAEAILSDITLYNDARVRAATDLQQELAPELEEGRVLFGSRVAPELHRIYEDEILAWTGRAQSRAEALAPAKVEGGKLLFLVGLVVALGAVVAWLVLRHHE